MMQGYPWYFYLLFLSRLGGRLAFNSTIKNADNNEQYSYNHSYSDEFLLENDRK